MPEVGNKECLFKCESCGAVISATWNKGVLGIKKGWRMPDGSFLKEGSCPQCHQKMKLKGRQTVLCESCGRLVEKTEDNTCLKCGNTLNEIPSRGSVECPECGMGVIVPEGHHGDLTCQICGTVISEADLKEMKIIPPPPAKAVYIKLPDVATMEGSDSAIWKHPQNEFAFQSRMQVNEGTIALFLQNGVCKTPCPPGDYLLQNTDLSVTEKLQAAFAGSDKVFKTDIYCLLTDLPEIEWGCLTSEFWTGEHDDRYKAGANGRISLQIARNKGTDKEWPAEKYIKFLTFKPRTISELVFKDPDPTTQNDGPLVKLVRTALAEAICFCLSGKPAEVLKRTEPDESFRKLVIAETNHRLAEYGLEVKSLWINRLNLLRSTDMVEKDQIRDYVQSENEWHIGDVRLHRAGENDMYADLDFNGAFKLQITDDKLFENTSEVKKLKEERSLSKHTVQAEYKEKVEKIIANILPLMAQRQIDRKEITDFLDPNQYIWPLCDNVREQLNSRLSSDGLMLASLDMSLPTVIRKSDTLANSLEQPARRQTVLQAVESVLQLSTKPIRVHQKGDNSIWRELVFGGKCRLRVQDEEGFFKSSEVRRILDSNQPVSETAVRANYISSLTPMFEEILSRVAQSIVDQTNADIREMNRFTMLLKNSVLENMRQRVEQWGLRLEYLDMDMPSSHAESANLDKMVNKEETMSGLKLDEEIQRMQNDHTIFGMDEDVRIRKHEIGAKKDVTLTEMDAEFDISQHELERKTELELLKLRKGADLDKLADEIRTEKDERRDEALLEEYKRQFRIREEQINEKIREEKMLQDARIDREMEQQRAELDKKLADIQNQAALNDLMHKIDESNLTWQQKLDEYERLRRMTQAKDSAEIKKLESDTKIQITKDENEAWYQSDSLKLRLSAEQAQLMEQIARYAEDRRERVAAADEARAERRATLDFEQKMQDRREYVAQQIQQIEQRYAQELAMRDKEVDLEKLKAELDLEKFRAGAGADVSIAQAEADMNARIAEAQAAIKRAEDQYMREESLAKQAEEFKKELLEIQKVLEMTRLGNDRNKDDKMAEVVVATAQAMGGSGSAAGRGGSDQYDHLERKMERVINSVNSLRGRINELKHRIEILSAQAGAGYAPYSVAGSSKTSSPAASGSKSSMKTCSLCHKPIPGDAVMCPYCGNPILS